MGLKEEIWARLYTDEAKVPDYQLPSPLTAKDGHQITTAYEWMNFQRPELLKLFREQMYGDMPGRPDSLRFELLSERGDALNDLAVRKEIRIHCGMNDGRSCYFDLLLYLPKNAVKPVPAFLGLNFKGNQACTVEDDVRMTEAPVINIGSSSWFANEKAKEELRGCQVGRWQLEEVIRRGYATATIYYGEIFPDDPEAFGRSIFRLFYSEDELKAENKTFGAIGAWAWGLSRALDCLENEPMVDASRVAVHGHSRLGKTALWAGACDSRFALVISNCSGCGGAALSMRGFGENLEWLLYWRTYWFNPAWRRYINRERELPFDQHELIALIAPRPVYVASASRDDYADPKGEFLALVNAGPVYRLFGSQGLEVTAMPPVNTSVGGDLRYHLREGEHEITRFDWQCYLDFADYYWKDGESGFGCSSIDRFSKK